MAKTNASAKAPLTQLLSKILDSFVISMVDSKNIEELTVRKVLSS